MMDGGAQETILVVSLGRTPQVVTETLWSLLNRAEPLVPSEIHMLTTRLGERDIRGRDGGVVLCDPDREGRIGHRPDCRLVQLFRSFGCALPRVRIHTPAEQVDLRDEEASIAYADLCVRVLATLRKERPKARLHVSIAGGRKIMSFYMGYALSLLGSPGDELSHVLISPADFEGRDFWWPGGPPGRIRIGGADRATADARVELVPVPFLALREYVDEALLTRLVEGSVGFGELVRWMSGRIAPELRLFRSRPELEYGDAKLRLQPLQAAMLHVLARAWSEQWAGFGPEGAGGLGWLSWRDFEEDSPALRAFLEAYGRLAPGRSPELVDDMHTIIWHGVSAVSDLLGYRRRLQEVRAKLRRRLEGLTPVGPAALRIEYRQCSLPLRNKKGRERRQIFGVTGVTPGRIRFED